MSTVGDIAANLVAAALMLVLAILSYFVIVFVVDAGASLAGFNNNQLVPLAAAVLAGSAIVAGGIAPVGEISSIDRSPEDPLQ